MRKLDVDLWSRGLPRAIGACFGREALVREYVYRREYSVEITGFNILNIFLDDLWVECP